MASFYSKYRAKMLAKMQSKMVTMDEFNYDALIAPPMYRMLSPEDIYQLHKIASSIKLSGKINQKYQMIDDIFRARGFTKVGAGTNRVVYESDNFPSIVIKCAVDYVGIQDNPREFVNQEIFKPYVTKVFEVSPCGTVGVFEKVTPIRSREEFMSVLGQVLERIVTCYVGEYVLEDIGTQFFMNYGIRIGFGPILLDYPYVYKLDGAKLFCNHPDPNSPMGVCGGEIDYDGGFNFLRCTKCGVKYRAPELAKAIDKKTVVVKANPKHEEESKMVVKVNWRGKERVVVGSEDLLNKSVKKIERKQPKIPVRKGGFSVDVTWNGKTITHEVDTTKILGYTEEELKPALDVHVERNAIVRPQPERGIVKMAESEDVVVEELPEVQNDVVVEYIEAMPKEVDPDTDLNDRLFTIDDWTINEVDRENDMVSIVSPSTSATICMQLFDIIDNPSIRDIIDDEIEDSVQLQIAQMPESDEIKKLKAAIKNLEADKKALTASIDKKDKAIADLTDTINSSLTKEAELEKKLREASKATKEPKTAAKYKQEIAELKAEIEELKSEEYVAVPATPSGVSEIEVSSVWLKDAYMKTVEAPESEDEYFNDVPHKMCLVMKNDNNDFVCDQDNNVIAITKIDNADVQDILEKYDEEANK